MSLIKKLYNKIKNMSKDFTLNYIASGIICNRYIRVRIYKFFGNNIQTYEFSPRCFLGYGKGKLYVGTGTFVNYNCFFDLGADIHIGNNCNIAANVSFINSTHEFGNLTRRAGAGIANTIKIGDGCWLGGNSTILPGVTVGDGCIIGAGSLVVKDCDKNTLYGGVPAKKMKSLNEY